MNKIDPMHDASSSLKLSDQECPIWTEEDVIIADNLTFYFDGILVCLVAFIGLIINSTALFIIHRKAHGQHIFNLLFGCLFGINTFILGSAILTRLFVVFKIEAFGILFPCVSHPFYHIAMTASIYMTIALTIERHVSIKSPVYYNHLLRTTRTKIKTRRFLAYFVSITTFATLYNIPRFLEFSLSNGRVEPTHLVNQLAYRNQYQNWFSFLVLGILPFISLGYLSLRIYKNLKTQEDQTTLVLDTTESNQETNRPYGLDHLSLEGYKSKQHENEMARIVIGIVVMFLVCHLVRVLSNLNAILSWNAYSECKERGRFPGINVWQYNFTIFGVVLVIIHSGINMPLYYIFNIKLRNKNFGAQKDFDQGDTNDRHCQTVHEVKGEPDGASEILLADEKRMGDFSTPSLFSKTKYQYGTRSDCQSDLNPMKINEDSKQNLIASVANNRMTLGEKKGEPDGASKPVLTEVRKLSNCSGISLASTGIKDAVPVCKGPLELCTDQQDGHLQELLVHSDPQSNSTRIIMEEAGDSGDPLKLEVDEKQTVSEFSGINVNANGKQSTKDALKPQLGFEQRGLNMDLNHLSVSSVPVTTTMDSAKPKVETLHSKNRKTSTLPRKKQMTIAKSSLTPLLLKQNTLDD